MDFAPSRGLFADNFASAAFIKTHHRSKEDFLEFGRRIGVRPGRAEKLLTPFLEKQEKVAMLINRSFLDAGARRAYEMYYNAKRNSLV